MTLPALYELAGEYRAAAEQLADLDLPPEVVADTLEGLAGDLEQKATNVALFARNLEATAAAIKQAEADMAARRKAIENRAASIRTPGTEDRAVRLYNAAVEKKNHGDVKGAIPLMEEVAKTAPREALRQKAIAALARWRKQ